MKKNDIYCWIINYKKLLIVNLILPFIFFASCVTPDPRKVDVQLKHEPPTEKITSFSDALLNLGKMTEIYGTIKLNIQCQPIMDDTGTSGATDYEIPKDITEMLKSSLNAIGGNVVYIPYDPTFLANTVNTGYSTLEDKIIPNIVMSGGITEFDRGLETRGKNTDIGVETKPFTNAPKWFPGDFIGGEYGEYQKSALSSITLDFNLIDLKTMAGISRMQTVNTVKVDKAVGEKEIGFTLFGPTFGFKGTVQKVQGRHAAIRLLVQLSVIQIIGKYLKLPYWILLPNAKPDPVVLDNLKTIFYRMDSSSQIAKIQELLYIQGNNYICVSGILDDSTRIALQRFDKSYTLSNKNTVDMDTFIKIYTSIPINEISLQRRFHVVNCSPNQEVLSNQNKDERINKIIIKLPTENIDIKPDIWK